MKLKSIKFVESEGTPQEWILEEFLLMDTNLIVGKNASGKTRTLHIIRALANMLSGGPVSTLSGGRYDAEFIQDDGTRFAYKLTYGPSGVTMEEFSINEDVKLSRKKGGEGEIWAEDINDGTKIRFQTPISELAAVARRDTIQHSYLENLFNWGNSLRHFYFGSDLGKGHFALLSNQKFKKIDKGDAKEVVSLLIQAEKEFKGKFKKHIIQDMIKLGYEIEEIGVQPPVSIRIEANIPGELVCLYVKEKDLLGITDQHSMSQGMFRALSLLIHVNYVQLKGKTTCILIDDIGEGLDFDRSCRLIDLLRKKTKTSKIQLVLSTNDRYVMNRVPLKEWSVLQRQGNFVRVLNIENSKDLFEEFKFTGMSNFSFLEMDFANEPISYENKPNE
jgi:ABC-type cobalamin/Fe3+-siderophores transport system ATPase subunit